MHPLLEDLSKLTDKELAERINKIVKIMRTGGRSNGFVYNQAYAIHLALQEEQARRNRAAVEAEIKKSGEGDNFNDFINIG